MRGYRRPSASPTCRAVWRYAALGLGATLTAVFSFIAAGRLSSPSVIAVGSGPMAIAITPDGRAAYAANATDNSVTPVSLANGAVGSAIVVNGYTAGPVPSGRVAIAIAPDGATAYVSDPATGVLIPISLRTGTTGVLIPWSR